MLKHIFVLIFLTLTLFAKENVIFSIDFSQEKDTNDTRALLEKKGFIFKLDAEDFTFSIHKGRLYIETQKEAAVLFGKFVNTQEIPAYALIEWGVASFPKGADWESGNNRLPIGVIMVFGKEKLSSGLAFLAPKAPTFLCPFIGEKEQLGKPYLGKLYKKGGRYYCLSNSGEGKLIRSRFDIAKEYEKAFKKSVEPLSAIAFQVNTKDTDGKAKAFIQRVTIYSK